ncbi:MAG: tetratricopeptide repeat protein [Rubrivivax sp.]|nr:tetratricopeptide repeat protein [Rubrivivax sp.]
MALRAYLPQDRLRALAQGQTLPETSPGTALFADIAGFTALTESLTEGAGLRPGVETLAQRINGAYQALIEPVERLGGSVIGLAGDGMTCWFAADDDDTLPAAGRAVLSAWQMLQALRGFEGLSLKVGLGSGSAQRLAVGDPQQHLIDLLLGPPVTRALRAERLAAAGELLVDAPTAAALAWPTSHIRSAAGGEHFHVMEPARIPPPEAAPARAGARPSSPALEQLQPWIQPWVFERESAGGLFATDLRPATALFLRLPQPAAGPDASHSLSAQVALIQQRLQQHGGVLLEASADAAGICLYASFGAAQVHEDDAARALRAALDLQAQLRPLTGELPIGLSCGTMVVGGYGGPTRRSFGAMGFEVNLAARLMAEARPGEVLVSGRLRQAAGEDFAFEARAPMPLRGKTEPMPVFALTGLLQRRAMRLQEPQALLPMVGREAETRHLEQLLARALQGQGQILRVVAEAGMGKSRLLAEGIRLARRAGFIGYGGTCRLDGVQTPYALWQGVWTAWFDIDPALPPRRQQRAVQAALQRSAPAQAEAWPLVGTVLGQDWPDTPFTLALQPAGRKTLLQGLLLACLQHAAAEAAEDGMGLLLVLEDLQAADPLSLELLGLLARSIEALPVCLMCAERPAAPASAATPALSSSAALPDLPYLSTLELGALSPPDVEHLVRARLALQFPERGGRVPRALIERVTERAQGNPFFVEELLGYLHDRGLDARELDDTATLELPGSLHSLVLSRIDGLPWAQQRELKAASVIGREFTARELQGYCPALGSPEAVRADLQTLDRLGFTPAITGAAEPTHGFRHVVTHQVSYQSLPTAAREELHGQYARYLEQAHAGRLAPLAAVLAHHVERSASAQAAGPYLLMAGRQAAEAYANEEALAFFGRALKRFAPEAHAQRFELLMQRQAVLDLLGRRELQRADLDALEQLASLLDDPLRRRCTVGVCRARLDIVVGDYAAAEQGAQAAAAALDQAGPLSPDSSAPLIDALLLQAQALHFAGRGQAGRPALDRALSLATACAYRRGEITARSHTGLLHWHAGDGESAERWLQQALALSRSEGLLRLELDMLNNLGLVAKGRGRLKQAIGHYGEAQRIARRLGDRSGEAVLLLNLGSLALAAGDFQRAGRFSEEAAAIFAGANEPVQHALALINRAEAHRETGQLAPAEALATQALALLRSSGFRRGEAVVMENLGLIALAQGRLEAALAHTAAALALARSIGLRSLEGSVLLHQAQMLLMQGERAQARQTLDEAEALLQSLGADGLLLEVQAAQAWQQLPDEPAAALEHIDRILPRLMLPAATLEGPAAHEAQTQPLPMGLYTSTWQMLHRLADPRAAALLSRAREELERRCEPLTDPRLRADFLAMAEHRALLDGT